MRKFFSVIMMAIAMGSFTPSLAVAIQDTLYINQGKIYSVDSVQIPVLCFNTSPQFDPAPGLIQVQAGNSLELVIVNQDSVTHQIRFEGSSGSQGTTVESGAHSSVTLTSEGHDVIRVYSKDEAYKYAGLAGMVVFYPEGSADHRYFWNLREYQVGLTEDFSQLGDDYGPEYFTINNRSFPHTTKDSLGYMTGTVGDTIELYVYNAGLMHHNLHFHGYHAAIILSTSHPHHKGRLKDSFPVDKNEVIVFRVVPHQPGKFPVHNHNLGATLGNNIYPNGMVSQINISSK